MTRLVFVLAVVTAATVACTGGGNNPDPIVPRCTASQAVAPTCQDEQIQQLFYDTPTDGVFTNNEVAGIFTTGVDATAGGIGGSEGFLYGKFTQTGLIKVDITDEESLDSMDWDIAFRRFIVRLNSGPSGPSCVAAAEVPGSTFFDLDEVPSVTFETETYFDGTCTLIPDDSGLPTSPAVVLGAYWTYPGCVAMTGNLFVVALGDGHHVKLEVLQYYGSGQQGCDDNGTMGSQSANFQVRWAHLD